MKKNTESAENVKWTNIIQYHRDIIEKGEKTFYSIDVLRTERYVLLKSFQPQSFTGPWRIPIDEDKNLREFLKEQQSDKNPQQLMLGCLCWINNKQVDNCKKPHLSPAICLDVRVDAISEEYIDLIPDVSKWEFSPLVEEELGDLSYRPDRELHELLPDFINKAEAECAGAKYAEDRTGRNDGNLCRCLRAEIIEEIPVLKDILKDGFKEWLIFAPPKSYTFNKSLLADYKEIEKRLDDNPEDLGGLRLLGGYESDVLGEKQSVLPVVPLNKEQQVAVSAVLSGTPVNVISGPPGCGKSQVVVSLLINSWAQGMSVLFASNNNKAVDVIRERVKSIESTRPLLPVIVKAGKKSKNHICDDLTGIKNAIAGYNFANEGKLQDLIEKQKKLETDKTRYKNYIQTGVPQQIEESLSSAFDAYNGACDIRQELDTTYGSYRLSLKEIGYSTPPEDFEKNTAELEGWLKKIPECEQEIAANDKERKKHQDDAEDTKRKIEEILNKIGQNSDLENWLDLEIDPAEPKKMLNWYEKYKSVLSLPLEKDIDSREVGPEYKEWTGKKEAETWAKNAKELMESIYTACRDESGTIKNINATQVDYTQKKGVVNSLGISDSADIDSELLENWMAGYKEYVMLPKSLFSNLLPFSRKNKLDKELRDLEKQVYLQFPVSVGCNTGISDDQSRKELSQTVEDTLGWLDARQRYEGLASESERINSLFSELCQKLKWLKFFDSPKCNTDTDAWTSIADSLSNKIDLADKAAGAWDIQEQAHKRIEDLTALASEFEILAPGNPIKKLWITGTGKEFSANVRALIPAPNKESLSKARDSLYSNNLESSVGLWRDLPSLLDSYRSICEKIDKVPTKDDIISEWWGEEPSFNKVEYGDHSTFPGDDSYQLHLDECKGWVEEWKKYSETELPAREAECKKELEWARDEIKSVCEKIPDEEAKKEISDQILVVTEKNDENWPIQELRKRSKEFRSAEINIRIARIDYKQQALSFEIASEKRITEIKKVENGKKDLDELYSCYKHNNNSLPMNKSDLFVNCLRAAPIWITTSLSTQSIPMKPGIFDIVVVDEASQCDISSVLPLIYRAKHLAVIGDPKQLSAIPVISSPEMDNRIAMNHGVGNMPDMFRHINNDLYHLAEQSLSDGCQVVNLSEHYRSHPLIVGFLNLNIYLKQLTIMRDIECSEADLKENGIFGIDIRGNCVNAGKSWQNDKEAKAVADLVADLVNSQKYDPKSIGIVTPFRSQVNVINTELDRLEIGDVTVGTAHTFQGDERSIIIFSAVMSESMTSGAVNFIQNPVNLINVALSRAKDSLYVVADYRFCKKSDGIMAELIKYIETVDSLRKSAETGGYEKLYLFSLMLAEGWKPGVNVHIGGRDVDFTLKESGVSLAVNVFNGTEGRAEEKEALFHDILKQNGYDAMEIRARKISDTPKEVISDIKKKINF